MDLGYLDKSSPVTPLLVDLYENHALNNSEKDVKPSQRVDLLEAVGALFDLDVTPRESEMIADVMIDMLRQAKLDIRMAVSARLSIMDNISLRLILQVANDEIDVARPVLLDSSVLEDLDMIYIIKSQGPEYWQVLAGRKILGDQVVEVLANTGDIQTAVALAENMNLKLTEQTVVALSDLAQNSEIVATPLLRRDEVSNEIAAKLYQYVGEKLKQEILEKYNIDNNILIDAVEDVVQELIVSNERSEFKPSLSMLRLAKEKKEQGQLNVQDMLSTLKRGQLSSFIAEFSFFTGMSYSTIEGILTQPSGQGLAMACRACDIAKSDFVSMYLLTNRVRNKGRMVDVSEMAKAVSYFNRIEVDIAKNIMANSISDELKTP